MQVKEKRCRRCGTTDPRRFTALGRTECVRCRGARRADRPERPSCKQSLQVEKQPPTAKKSLRVRPGSDPAHLAWIRTLPCSVPGCRVTPCHAHHVRAGNTGGTGMKPPDRCAVPLCPMHHGEGHQTGWKTFEAKYRVDLAQIPKSLSLVK
jgi:hypothetical protein